MASEGVVQTSSQAIENATQGIKKGILTEDAGNMIKIIGIVGAMLAIVFVTMYIVNMLKSNSLKKVKLLKKNVIQLDNRQTLPQVIPASSLATGTRGQEFSFSFWVYLSDSYDKTANHKVIFQRGTDTVLNGTSLPSLLSDKTNPIVVMDKDTNKMMFAVNTSAVNQAMSLNDIFARDPLTKRYKSAYLVSSIDYIPLQRWVHITMAVRDNMMALYMDGDLYSIVTTNDAAGKDGKIPFIRMPIGDITVGDPVNSMRGFIAKFNYYNYSLTQSQIMKDYKEGPQTTTFLSYFGLSRYGVRSPIYEVDADK